MEIAVKIISASRRKYIACRVGYGGVLEVFLPAGKSVSDAENFVLKNRDKIAGFMAASPAGPRYDFAEGEFFPLFGKTLRLRFSRRLRLIDEDAGEMILPCAPAAELQKNIAELYIKKAPELLAEKCRLLGEPFGLFPTAVEVADTSSRWGCCYSSGKISFCWKVLLLPEDLADYVVCHELAHLRHLDHSEKFWKLTAGLCPDALEKRQKLRRQPELWPPSVNANSDQLAFSMLI